MSCEGGVAGAISVLAPIVSPALRQASPAAAASEKGVDVYFSPDGGCEDAIVAAIAAAKKSIDVQAYFFTNARLRRRCTRLAVGKWPCAC